jgi:cytidine deaminase
MDDPVDHPMDVRIERELVDAARAATAQAFLTQAGGRRYGAAVRTLDGRTFTSGQYSSWNHSTNIHAEMGALLQAAMAGFPDVIALAVASNATAETTRPCGVCRQVMQEHAQRTGRDFHILMASPNGTHERARVSDLLPFAWSAATQPKSDTRDFVLGDRRDDTIRDGLASGIQPVRCGDHVVCGDGAVTLVWDEAFAPDAMLGKIKYAPATGSSARDKVAHAFTQPIAYEAELARMGWDRPAPCGGVAPILGPGDVVRHLPSLPAASYDDVTPVAMVRLLGEIGIVPGAATVSGSRSLGVEKACSDWDIVLRVTVEEATRLRSHLAERLHTGAITVPEVSGTWKILAEMFPGGRSEILAQRRFAETFTIDGGRVSLLLTDAATPPPCIDRRWAAAGRGQTVGVVVEAARSVFKRAEYTLCTADQQQIDVVCYHKTANLVREGDRLAIRGWLMTDGTRRRLVQLSSWRDNIVWLPH